MIKINNKIIIIFTTLLIVGIAYSIYIKIYLPNIGVMGLVKITEQDPLFISPELSIDSLGKSLDFLREDQFDLIRVIGLNDEVVATGFLGSLSEIKAAEDKFLDSPSKESGNTLILSYKKSLGLYKDEIEMLKEHLLSAFPLENEQQFVSFGSMTTNRIMNDDLDLMLRNAEQLGKEIVYRERIINRRALYTDEKLGAPQNLKPSDYRLYEASPPIDNNSFPVYLVRTDCFGNNDSQSIFSYLSFENKDGQSVFKPKIANNKYYQKLSASLGNEKQYIDQGLEWRLITEGNTYRCNNLEYQASLRNLVFFTDEYRDKLLFTDENLDKIKMNSIDRKIWGNAADFEAKLLHLNGYYSEEDLMFLSQYYEYFYRSLTKDSDLKENFRLRYLLINNKQSRVSEIINTKFFLDDLYKRAQVTNVKGSEAYAKQLYGSRMSYSFVFFNFSGAVWRIEERPAYVGGYLKNDHFATVEELNSIYSEGIIKKMDEISYIEVRGY